MELAVLNYADWIACHTPKPWLKSEDLEAEDIELQAEETWECYRINGDFEIVEEGFEVNAWFLHDWRPLTQTDIERGIEILTWTRDELLETVSALTQEALERRYPNERWNISGILKHVAGAEWWYLDRLDLAFSQDEIPKDPFERLASVRSALFAALPTLQDSERVIGKDGEFWSPRKLLRRAAWHELDHIGHIQKLMKK
jgi:uncharacterized damage-inducible protein DinB